HQRAVARVWQRDHEVPTFTNERYCGPESGPGIPEVLEHVRGYDHVEETFSFENPGPDRIIQVDLIHTLAIASPPLHCLRVEVEHRDPTAARLVEESGD